jgi:hypothetical protein
MASVISKDIPEEFNMFGELFNLYKKHYKPEQSDQYWKDVLDDFKALNNKYGTQLSKDLSHAIMDELERKERGS